MKIFCTFEEDNDSFISKIGFNSKIFPKESVIYYQDINIETEVTDNENWLPYEGKIPIEFGYLIVNKFYINEELPEIFEELTDLYKYEAIKYNIYKDGKVIRTEIIKENY